MSVLSFEPRTIAEIPKNARDAYRLQIIRTDEGPRVSLMVYRRHPDGAVPLRCLGHFRVEVLRDLAIGLNEAERVMREVRS